MLFNNLITSQHQGRLKEETMVTDSAYQPFRLQNQYCERAIGLYYNFFRYYEPDAALPKWIAYGVLGAAATGVVALSESDTCTGKCQEEKT